jgi:glucose/arabinose dehydrogenase
MPHARSRVQPEGSAVQTSLIGLAAATLVTALALANPLAAQKPELRRVVAVRGALSTPSRMEWNPALVSKLRAPAGFRVSVWAERLGAPRMFAMGRDGTLYVTRRDSNDVIALRDDGRGRALPPRVVVKDLANVHGIAVHGQRLYLATIKELYVVELGTNGDAGQPRAIVTDLPDGGQHPNRTLAIGPDSMLYVTVGSSCNACSEPNREHATMLRVSLDGRERGIYARGLRNTLGFGWHPVTSALWGMDHGSDWRGNDVPLEELNELRAGTDYGWPWCWGARRVDSLTNAVPPNGPDREGYCKRTGGATLTYTAHAAPMQMVFYTGTQFPAEYRHDAFVAMRGSWNREPVSGYEVVRVRFRNDGSPERIEPFLTGFVENGGRYFGRPVGMAVLPDGSLLVGDDTNGAIYRIAHGSGAGNRSSSVPQASSRFTPEVP